MARDEDLRSMSKRDLEREILRLRGLLEAQMAAAPDVGGEITVHGIVGIKTREPIVSMRAGEAAWQLSPARARQHALIILDAAVEAERDAATIAFLEEADMSDDQIGAFLVNMRDRRAKWLDEMRTAA